MTYKPDLVFFHYICDDGVTAAAVVANYYSATAKTATTPISEPKGIDFKPWNYQKPYKIEELIDTCRGKHVMFVDCSAKKDEIDKIAQSAESILLIDHHITAKQQLEEYMVEANINNIESTLQTNKIAMVYDVNYCGGSLTFKFFHPQAQVPAFIKYVEDIDLGKEELPNSAYFKFWNRSNKIDLAAAQFNIRTYTTVGMLEKIFESGKEIYRYAMHAVDMIAKEHRIGMFGSEPFPFAFGTYNSGSDVANAMIAPEFGNYKFAILFYFSANGLGASIRSIDGFDCSVIAKEFGGGGHATAAGFNIPWSKLAEFNQKMQDAGTNLFGQQ